MIYVYHTLHIYIILLQYIIVIYIIDKYYVDDCWNNKHNTNHICCYKLARYTVVYASLITQDVISQTQFTNTVCKLYNINNVF